MFQGQHLHKSINCLGLQGKAHKARIASSELHCQLIAGSAENLSCGNAIDGLEISVLL